MPDCTAVARLPSQFLGVSLNRRIQCHTQPAAIPPLANPAATRSRVVTTQEYAVGDVEECAHGVLDDVADDEGSDAVEGVCDGLRGVGAYC